MKLYLVRHTTAVDNASSDAARALTMTGEAEARVVGQALARLGVQPTHIFASPLVRARRTAELIAEQLGMAGKVATLDELENYLPTTALLKALPAEPDGVMILVGHMPSLSDHVAALADLEPNPDLAFSKGGVALVEMPGPKVGTGQFVWLKQLRELR
jgi:phosphohistidine phosphatase